MNHKKNTRFSTRELTLIGLMSAVLCIIAPFPIPLPFSPVPITFATFILYLDIYILKTKASMTSCFIYLFLGLVGLPVFSGFSGGIGRILGPTGGYLIGYIFLVLIGGLFIEHADGKKWICFSGLLLGTGVTYLFGSIWLSIQMDYTLTQTFLAGVLPYLPGDFLKMILAIIIGPLISKRLHHVS